MLVERLDALVDELLQVAIGLSEQPLERDRRFQAAIPERLQHAADDPPELVHLVARRGLLERAGDFLQRVDLALRLAALDPAEQRQLEIGAQPHDDGSRIFAGSAAQQPFDVGRQLHHGPRQGIEAVLTALAGPQGGQVARRQFHLLDQQGRAVGFGQLQGAARLVDALPS